MVAGTVVTRDEGMTGGLLPEPLVQIMLVRAPSSMCCSNGHNKLVSKPKTKSNDLDVILDKIRRVVDGFNEFIASSQPCETA